MTHTKEEVLEFAEIHESEGSSITAEMLRAYAALLGDGPVWRTMESAPRAPSDHVKDRKHYLLWDGGSRPFIGWPTMSDIWMDEEGDDCLPSHWMPLPPTPTQEGEG